MGGNVTVKEKEKEMNAMQLRVFESEKVWKRKNGEWKQRVWVCVREIDRSERVAPIPTTRHSRNVKIQRKTLPQLSLDME